MKPTNDQDVTDSPEDIARGSLQQLGSGYVEVPSIEVKIGDEFWCPHCKRWLPVEVTTQRMGVCIGEYRVRRKSEASSSNDQAQRPPCNAA